MMLVLTKTHKGIAAIIGLLCMLTAPAIVHGQVLSSSGKDFWLGYGAHAGMFNADGTVNSNGGTQDMRIFISAVSTANVTIEIPLTGWNTTVNVKGGTIDQQVIIPKSGANDARLTGEGIFNKGIHITSDVPVSAYCHIYSKGSSSASLLVPEELLGQDYYTLGATQEANEPNSFSWCFVVATADGTIVEVTPSANTLSHAANVPFTQTLKRGQVLNLVGELTSSAGGVYKGVDLSGTHIRTISNSIGPCKKIAVFSGSSNTSIACDNTPGTADNLFQQALPYRTWGRTYYTMPAPNMTTTAYRVLVNKPTQVRVNGSLLNDLINDSYYEFRSDKPCKIVALSPVQVAQYSTSQNECSNTGNGTNGDPDMVYLFPFDYSVSHINVNLPTSENITANYVNVILRTVSIDSFRIDDLLKKNFFKPYPNDASYSYGQIPLSPGFHSLTIDTLSFTAIAYGHGAFESYSYNAGFNITRLSSIAVKNPYSQPNQQSICRNVPFKMVFTLKKKADELIFDFQKNPALSPNGVVHLANPVADSVYYNGTDSSYRYTLPADYVYTGISAITVAITEFIPTAEDCIEKRDVTYNINVTAKPIARINVAYNTCGDDTLSFKDNSTWNDGSFTHWLWQFGDGNSIDDANPVKHYSKFGDYKVQLRSITQNGCYADDEQNISLNPLPKVDFNFSGLYCPGNDIKFTDASTVASGWQITKRAWSFGDGSTSSSTNPTKQFAAGDFKVKLVAYTNKNCSDSTTKPIKIYAVDDFKEFITITNAGVQADTLLACNATPFKLSVTFTLRQVQLLWGFNNNPNLSPDNDVRINNAVPDSVYSNGQDSFFRYSLPANYIYAGAGALALKVTAYTLTKGGCLAETVFPHTINVLQKPMANWQLTYNQCSNDTLHFIDQSTGNGSNIKLWAWNFDDGTAGKIPSPIKKYADFGDYNVSLHIETELGCIADTIMPVSLSPAPVAVFNVTAAAYCPGQNIVFTDASTVGVPGKIEKWAWNFGNGSTSGEQSPFTAYNNAGDYNVTLITTTNHNCTATTSQTVTIFANPTITISPDIFIYAGTPYQLSPAYTGTGLIYMWTPATYLDNPAIDSPFTTAEKDITYNILVKGDGGCQVSTNVNVHVVRVLNVPNAFSPNGDGINDKWMIENIEGYPNCTIKVFNRYGQAVFSSVGYSRPWDGTLNGTPLPVGTYYYIIDTKSKKFPGTHGDVTILR